MIDRALPLVREVDPSRPCHYGPWAAALQKLERIDTEWPQQERYYFDAGVGDLMSYASRVSAPGWPEDHSHLVDFTLRFLEADVMLFRSGYTKRHLLRRLRQARLDTSQTHRAEALIRRAVVDGTGLEEFREFCRLASRLQTDDLLKWLTATAEGAFITINEFEWPDYSQLEAFDSTTHRKLTSRYGLFGRPKYAVRSDFSLPIVKTAHLTADNKIKINAWRMLRQIQRSQAARPRRPT